MKSIGLANLLFLIFMDPAFCLQGSAGTAGGGGSQELIPDDVAFEMMFFQISDGPAALARGNRYDYMGKANLSQEQVDIVIDAANQYRIYSNAAIRRMSRAKLEERATAETEGSARLAARLKGIEAKVKENLAEVLRTLESDLGVMGYQKLLAFVRTKVKAETIAGRQQRITVNP